VQIFSTIKNDKKVRESPFNQHRPQTVTVDIARNSDLVRPENRIYFGWKIVLALFLCTFALYGVSIYSFILLTTPMGAEYGWSNARMGTLVSAMWLTAPLALFFAPVIRKLGAWRLLFLGLGCQAVVMLGLAVSTELWHVYALRAFMGLGKIAIVVSVPVIITYWFLRRFATAIAIVWAGGSAGGFVLSPLTHQLIATLGWRPTSVVIAGGIFVFMAIVYLIMRRAASPADLGLEKDGMPRESSATESSTGSARDEEDEVLDLKSTLKSIQWSTAAIMFVAVVGLALAVVSILSQEPAILTGAGLSASTAATLLGVLSAAAMIGAASIGWILDRFPTVFGALLVSGLMYTGLSFLYQTLQAPSLLIAVLASAALGYAMGAGEVLWMTLTKFQFGAAAFATTYGGWFLAMQIGYGSGGGLSGWILENMGSTEVIVFVALVFLPAAIFSVWRPGKHQ
jgi:OFA family oxalate/formate antiporter-like MFS transporter